MVEEKPKFGYWTVSEAEYDREYSLAMELGRLQVFKGSVSADREQYQLVEVIGLWVGEDWQVEEV